MATLLKKPEAEIHESLDVYNDPPNPTVDIVAVPGLGANAVKSWQWDKPPHNFNWITEKKTSDVRDVSGLAKDCPTARVLLYNYASAYQGAYQVEQYMTNIVGIFLSQLQAKREGNPRRPLVLLGHSMGGLVIAKTLVMAETRRHDYPDIYEAISGCLFFGTPFNGAPVADIAKEWTTINERLGRAIDSQLITLLQPGNETLKELKDDFVRSVNKLGQKVRVHCFWERKKTHWEPLIAKLRSEEFPASSLGKLGLEEYRQFVSKESATLPGMDHTGIARTHRDLVRFESDKDAEYQLVKAPLRVMVNAAPRIARARFNDTHRLSIDHTTYRDILEVLDGAEPKRKLKALQQKLTSESWIVRDKEPHYVGWLNDTDRDNDYLWIHGPEGKGKSTAVAAIIGAVGEQIRSLEEQADRSPHLLAYFFCEATPDYCTAEDVIKSLMRQLCQQQEILATYATQFLSKKLEDQKRPRASLSIENLWQSLEEMLSEGTVDTIYFVINNLNELEQSPSTAKLLSFIQEDIERMSSGKVGKVNRVKTKWLITSRSHKAMKDILGSTQVRNIDLDDPKYGNQQQRALQKYAWIKAEDLQKTKGYTMAMTYLTGSVIGNRADNTKWIDVAIVQLAAFPAESSEIKVQRMLENVPQNFKLLLDAAWLSILKRDDEDMETIRELLRALVLTYEDPREKELLVLAGLSTHGEEGNADLQKLVSKCQPLVTTRASGDDVFIGFVNADVKRHLLEHSRELLDIGDEWTRWQHGKMSLRCFSHIMEAVGKGIEEMETQVPEAGKEKEKSSGIASEPETLQHAELILPKDESTDESKTSGETDGTSDQPTAPAAEANPRGPRLALDYATRHWIHHASDATLDVAEIISRDNLFWAPGSAQRQRWIQEYEDLTGSLTGFNFVTWKALHVAAAIGFPHLVAALLKEGYSEEVHEYDSLNNKPLHLAAYFGNVEILEELLNAGSPVDDTGPPGSGTNDAGPLAMAALNGQTDVMRKLIKDWNADINAIDNQTGPVLNAAIISGNTDAVNLLLENGVRINYGIDEVDVAPLAMSAYYSDMALFSTILEKTKSKLTPEEFDKAMIWASAAGNGEVLRTLLPFEHDHDAFQASLFGATSETNWDACLLILRHPPAHGLDCEDLFTRAAVGTETLVEVIQACWDNNSGGISQEVLDKCLYEATDKEKESTVELLLKLGASPNATGDEFGDSLTAAANDGTERIVSLLLDAGANVSSSHGYALQQAASQGHLDVVQMLISHGADVNEVSKIHESCTALQAACNSGHLEVVRLLLKSGANPNLGGGDYTRPIFGAILDGGKVLDEVLGAPELELDIVGGPFNGTPLATAIFCLPAERVVPLIDHGATIDFVDDDGDTALTAAAQKGDASCLRLLLERGADFLKISKRNETALQAAMENGNVECVNLLLARTDYMLRELQRAAEEGDERARNVIASEKAGRKEAMEKEAAEAKAKADAASKARDEQGYEDMEASESDGDDEVSEVATNSPSQELGKELVSGHAEDNPDVRAPAEESHKDALEHDLTGYPTPKSVMEDDDAEEDKTTEADPEESHEDKSEAETGAVVEAEAAKEEASQQETDGKSEEIEAEADTTAADNDSESEDAADSTSGDGNEAGNDEEEDESE